ncbi:MAG: AbrB/MazE/SpoVT family DNA-binding domain-containing protein [Nanobdellota archaeon]
MKKYPKVVQCDKRGQIVIPKDIRQTLEIKEGSAFYMYTVTDEGILLKKLPEGHIDNNDKLLNKIKEKAENISIDKKNIEDTKENYKKQETNLLEEI